MHILTLLYFFMPPPFANTLHLFAVKISFSIFMPTVIEFSMFARVQIIRGFLSTSSSIPLVLLKMTAL